MRIRLLIILMLLLGAGVPSQSYARRNSQTVRQQQRQQRQRQQQTQRQLNTTIEQTERQLEELAITEAAIATSNNAISRLTPRVDSLRQRSNILRDSISHLTGRIGVLRNNYAESLRAIRRQRQSGSATAFIFASDNLVQGWRRMRYLKELTKWNRSRSAALQRENALLQNKQLELDSAQAMLQNQLARLEHERQNLEDRRSRASRLIADLRRQTSNLNRVLERQQRQAQELDNELETALRLEAEERQREQERQRAEAARRQAEERERRRRDSLRAASETTHPVREPSENIAPAPTPTPTPTRPSSPESADLGASFLAAKGRLPMPIEGHATIISDFGRRTHSELSRVEVQNNGIDISSNAGASARAVFDGTVSMIIVMEGYGNVVLVRHGEYLTVYAGIENLSVRKGQALSAGERIGTVATGPGGNARLHFEVRHEKQKLDPKQWLRNR